MNLNKLNEQKNNLLVEYMYSHAKSLLVIGKSLKSIKERISNNER